MNSKNNRPGMLSVDRRGFFRKVLLKGLEKAESASQQLGERFSQLLSDAPTPPPPAGVGMAPSQPPPPLRPDHVLRPPGALAEALFVQTCSRCGECVKACPASCIVMDRVAGDGNAEAPPEVGGTGDTGDTGDTGGAGGAGGFPYIHTRLSPCVICDDLSCMKVCPTGALKLVPSRTDIRMGIARMDHQRCLRTAPALGGDEDCRLCVRQCPIGETAIGIDAAGKVEIRPGCTGCGVCEWVCPTEPASVVVEPLAISH